MDQWPDLTGRAERSDGDRSRRRAPRRPHRTFYVQIYARTGDNSL